MIDRNTPNSDSNPHPSEPGRMIDKFTAGVEVEL